MAVIGTLFGVTIEVAAATLDCRISPSEEILYLDDDDGDTVRESATSLTLHDLVCFFL